MSLAPLLVDVGSSLEEATGLVRYLLVFVFAAIPVIEILVVVPIAIGLGLDPVVTGVVAFAGNVLSVYALIACYRRVAAWLRRRRGDRSEPSDRYARARRLWDRYGLPGLAVGGPVLAGVHVAALVALLAGSRSRLVAAWMTAGIFAWTIVLVAVSAYGVSVLGLA
ncbi:Putative small multi-drug export protein [Halobiforma haloterrestris]|uniref:Putative small multi-drug export protein n=1 Tax=Natronobacterium haloterrestre TaxID=148448 RepID=A0A1I1F6J0_NATHA|nr:small multi-drug export protein [Halobiforma haloterrestris]SFB94576.1 Putative small multi-drug export protein [Halobiforma haloterrestris]